MFFYTNTSSSEPCVTLAMRGSASLSWHKMTALYTKLTYSSPHWGVRGVREAIKISVSEPNLTAGNLEFGNLEC